MRCDTNIGALQGRRASAGDAVRLFDERDADPLRARSLTCRYEISRLDATAGTVPEDESGARPSTL